MEDFGNLLFFHENGDASVNKIFYLLIIFFFGAIGVHKFLVRHYLSGFLYLMVIFLHLFLNYFKNFNRYLKLS